MDKTLGYILCCQSPGLFLAAVMLLLFYFARRKVHHTRAVLDVVLCVACAAGGVALYFAGMAAGHFTIRDFYVIRTSGWVGLGIAVAINVWLLIRGFLAVNRRRMAEKTANRAANVEALRLEQERKAAEAAAQRQTDQSVSQPVDQPVQEQSAQVADGVATLNDSAIPPCNEQQ